MHITLITSDADLISQAKLAYERTDKLVVQADWRRALDKSASCELMIVDILSTLSEPHKIDGYEEFAIAKMNHPLAADVPMVLIGAPDGYKLDSMVGWPNFVFGHVRRPVTMKVFRRMSTWV